MLKKLAMLAAAITPALTLVGCGGNNVSFREAEAYFVRNDVGELPSFITTEAERDSTLGMATTMSQAPTTIDFSKEVAVPVALPVTDVDTELEIASLSIDGETLVVNCNVKRGDKRSYTTRPFAMAIVGKADIAGVNSVRVEGVE